MKVSRMVIKRVLKSGSLPKDTGNQMILLFQVEDGVVKDTKMYLHHAAVPPGDVSPFTHYAILPKYIIT